MSARAIMVLGTSSHVGKSLITTALCRIFADHGVRVAPFKSQNMSLNSAATIEGLEIGRAQALQAEAARTPASVHMNPILLKPSGNMSSQVVVRGKVWGNVSASNYHLRRVDELMPLVRESYETLAAQYDVIVLEGAGSPAEINLKQHDIVNMRMAELANASCLLVGDIDRGGAFASLFGTVHLLEPSERSRIKGLVINKFRGDVGLLLPGVRMIEQRLSKPCLGVIPYLQNLLLEEEDSLGLLSSQQSDWMADQTAERPLRIAVVALPSFSNFTDFDSLQQEPSVSLRFCRTPAQLALADVVILPGSKQTASDLLWMRDQGLAATIATHAKNRLLLGICGGMQMLGTAIADPHGMEHDRDVEALGLLPFSTRMSSSKITRQVRGVLATPCLFGQPASALPLSGYEIHLGETIYHGHPSHFAVLHDGTHDGCASTDGRIVATYLHGIFDDDAFRHAFIASARGFHSLSAAASLAPWRELREASLNRLAETVRQSLDMAQIFSWVDRDYRPESAGVSQ
jgi:adenosylcobyric acid synthase